MESIFPLLSGGAITWVVLCIGASILYRRAKDKPILSRKPDDTIYYETSGSGCSNQNLITKFGGAQNCLIVAVTKDSFIVEPKFPFNLMFLPEIFGLEHHVSKKNISSIVEKSRFLGKSVTVEFSTSDGKCQSIELRLRKMDAFLIALRAK